MTEFLLKHFVKGYPDTSSPAVRTRCGNLAGTVGIVCNVLLCAGKFLAGFLSGSLAISADAVNNLSDASSSVIALLGFRIAAKPADDEHPYGHGRTEYLAGLAVSVMILLIGLELVKTSVGKIMAPEPIQAGLVPLAVLVASILVKLWMAAFNRQVGKQIGSSVLEATAADSRNDVIATSAVLVATLAQMIFGWRPWFLCGVVRGVDIDDEFLRSMMELQEKLHITIGRKRSKLAIGIHDLIVHDYGPGRQFASLHVEMAASQDVLASHDVIDQIERRFLEQEGLHVIIHYDPIVTDNNEVGEAREYLAKQVKRLDPRLTIHDLRMVPGETHTNLIFDLVVPHGFEMPECRLKSEVQAMAQSKNPKWQCVVTLENSYT